MGKLIKLPNIGKILEKSLNDIGINTFEELREIGTKEAFLQIRMFVDEGACLHLIYALEGAILGVRYTLLPPEIKTELKDFFNSINKSKKE